MSRRVVMRGDWFISSFVLVTDGHSLPCRSERECKFFHCFGLLQAKPQRLGQSCKERLFLWPHRFDPWNPLARAGTVGAIGARLASRQPEKVDTCLAKNPPTLSAAKARLCSRVVVARESSVL